MALPTTYRQSASPGRTPNRLWVAPSSSRRPATCPRAPAAGPGCVKSCVRRCVRTCGISVPTTAIAELRSEYRVERAGGAWGVVSTWPAPQILSGWWLEMYSARRTVGGTSTGPAAVRLVSSTAFDGSHRAKDKECKCSEEALEECGDLS